MGRSASTARWDAARRAWAWTRRNTAERVVDEVVALLRGEGGEEHLRALVRERERLAAGLEFEAAARLRDLISGIERIRLSRTVVTPRGCRPSSPRRRSLV